MLKSTTIKVVSKCKTKKSFQISHDGYLYIPNNCTVPRNIFNHRIWSITKGFIHYVCSEIIDGQCYLITKRACFGILQIRVTSMDILTFVRFAYYRCWISPKRKKHWFHEENSMLHVYKTIWSLSCIFKKR